MLSTSILPSTADWVIFQKCKSDHVVHLLIIFCGCLWPMKWRLSLLGLSTHSKLCRSTYRSRSQSLCIKLINTESFEYRDFPSQFYRLPWHFNSLAVLVPFIEICENLTNLEYIVLKICKHFIWRIFKKEFKHLWIISIYSVGCIGKC